MTTINKPSAVLNAVLDTCSDVADYERCAERIKVAMATANDETTNRCHAVARLMCAPRRHGRRLWVSEAMSQLCRAAAATLTKKLTSDGGDATLHPDDLPWDAGTVVFETPLFAVPEDFVQGDEGPIDVMQWATATDGDGPSGVVVVFWQSRRRSEPADLIHLLPPFWPRASWFLEFGNPVSVATDPNLCVLWSLWAMLRDRIAVTETRNAPRPSVRRWERRYGQPPEPIIVVTLRRPEGHHCEDSPGSSVDWTHQWIVDGHWRNQPYGTAHSLRRLQWIAPFIKGPEDKPLVVKEKIHAWTR